MTEHTYQNNVMDTVDDFFVFSDDFEANLYCAICTRGAVAIVKLENWKPDMSQNVGVKSEPWGSLHVSELAKKIFLNAEH